MALRVLLADESSAIKKVMQLALQDFAVEVKAVPVGLDVLPVTKVFKPDIVFADVLLTKRNGYDVCMDLKADSATAEIPVVLMWSGFMDLDDSKFISSGADEKLEKPFDADQLRQIVTNLVRKTQNQPLTQFLSFPTMPDFEEPQKSQPAVDTASANTRSFNIPEIAAEDAYSGAGEPIEEFASVPLVPPRATASQKGEDSWTTQDLTKFKIPPPPDEEIGFASKFVIPTEEIEADALIASGEFEEVSFSSAHRSSVARQQTSSAPAASMRNPSVQDRAEVILREEAREVLEAIAWKIIPDVAERIVREEINKLLHKVEKTI